MPSFKYQLVLLISLFFFSCGFAQDSVHVNWKAVSKKIAAGKYEIKLSGRIQPNWHMYARPDDADELAGIKLIYPDSSIKASQAAITADFRKIEDPIFSNSKEVAVDSIELIQTVTFPMEISSVRISLNYDVADKDNFIPEEQKIEVVLNASAPVVSTNRILLTTVDLKNPVASCGQTLEPASKGLLPVFGLGFLGGLVALILPCLFPMIPLTVSFFTKKSITKKAGIRNAFLYGFFIFFIYILLSLPFHLFESINPDILNNISTNVTLNVLFFIIFVIFSISFFGYFEITLPAGLSSKADSKAGAGNIIGIFFMALTLAIVSFSCTGPILGTLLAGALSGDGGAMRLTFGMGGFGLAIALPFALFALFPNWLNSLPKSGGWLNTVKVVLGFIELALALKFLSNADLVMHWGIFKREIFIGLWILIGLALTLYLFRLIRFPHDSPMVKIPKGRLITGIMTGLFTLYLLPGVTNTKWANLSLISGFPPPLYYSIYPGSDCILNLNCSKDYEQGLKMAKEQGKAVLLDFTGYACVNCRRMEENVWTNSEVFKVMKEKFIVISLYVDDKKKLPLSQQFTYTTKKGTSRDITTVGEKWSTFESENFDNNAQPLYVILSNEEVLMNNPVGYIKSPKQYLDWLQCGLDAIAAKK